MFILCETETHMRQAFFAAFMFCCLFSFSQDSSITKQDLKSAAKLFDISFTQKEIDTMFSDVKDNYENYKLMHKLSLNNNVPLSLWQSPVLPGMKFTEKQQPINWNIPTTISLPANKSDLAFYSIEQLASLIKNKKLHLLHLLNFLLND